MAKGQTQEYQEKNLSKDHPLLLDCPQCHSFISGPDLNKEKGIAKCSHCNYVFSFDEAIENDPIGAPYEMYPESLEILKLDSLLEFKINHLKAREGKGLGFLIFFALMWNIMLLPFLFFIFSSGQWYLLLFISAHLFAGLYMIQDILSTLFNTTTVEVTRSDLTISTTPFALPGQREKVISSDTINQLFVKRGNLKKPASTTRYNLYASLKNGKKILLVPSLNYETLKFLENEIEKYLGIKNISTR